MTSKKITKIKFHVTKIVLFLIILSLFLQKLFARLQFIFYCEFRQMYLQILRHFINENHDKKKKNELNRRFKQIVESIVVLFDVFFSSGLRDLLSVEKKKKKIWFRNFYILFWTFQKMKKYLIWLLHFSFREFLFDKKKCENDCFWIDQKIKVRISFTRSQ